MQQGVAEMIQQADSAAQTAAGAAASDTTSTIRDVGEGIRSIGALILDGEWSEALDQAGDRLASWFDSTAPDVLAAVFVGLVAYVVFRLVHLAVTRTLQRTGAGSSGLRDLIDNGLKVAGWSVVLLLALSQVGLDLTTAVAGLGILGLAVGFAAKDALENLISGVMIMVDRPFRVGDYLEIEGEKGVVTRFTLRSTRIRTLQDRTIVMPNIKMIDQKLINHSEQPRVRIDVPFGIAYKESIAGARETVLAILEGDDRVLADPEPEVVVVDLDDSSIDLELRFYVSDARQEPQLMVEYLEKVRVALGEAEIEIPFPHLQLFIDGAEGLAEAGIVAGRADRAGDAGARSDDAKDGNGPDSIVQDGSN